MRFGQAGKGIHVNTVRCTEMTDEEKFDTEAYWNAMSPHYYVPDVFGRNVLKAFIRSLNPQPMSFLEIGCGRGELMPLYKDFPRAVGLDFAEGMVKQSRKRVGRHKYNVEVFHQDITKGHLDERFDLVLTRTVLMHIHPDDIMAACANVAAMGDNLFIFEYWEEREPVLAVHNWLHQYEELFHALGYVTVSKYKRPDHAQILYHFRKGIDNHIDT